MKPATTIQDKPGTARRISMVCLVLIIGFHTGIWGRSERRILFEFKRADDLKGWQVTDGTTAGKDMDASVVLSPGGALVFSGILSPDTPGSRRLAGPVGPLQLRAFSGLEFRVRGDGSRYAVLLHVASHPADVAYRADFLTRPDRWTTAFLPFSDFRPMRRNAPIRHWPQIDLSRLDRISIQTDSEGAGRFSLRIKTITAVGN